MIPAFLNPHAGSADAARDALRAEGEFDVQETPPAQLAARVREAVDQGARRILVAGGDGSIGSVAGVLAGTGVDLAILPCGTLNHLAKHLLLPLDLTDAARIAAHGPVSTLDVGRVNEQVFVNTSSVGAYVTFVRMRDRLEHRIGYHTASLIAGLRLLVNLPSLRVTLELKGVTREYLTPLVFIGVGERELRLPALGARVPDGRRGLHVMVIRRRSGARSLALALAAAARGVQSVSRTPALDAFIVDRCRIEPRRRSASVDGEIVSVTPPLDYQFQRDALRVVTGQGLESLALRD